MNQNKKYIIGLFVSILVISIGVSFAYFATRSILTGNGTNTQGTTVSLGDTTVNIEGSPDFSDTNIYPGHKTVSRIKVTATGDKNIIYHLIWAGQNNLKTTLNYTVYKTTTEETPSITCERKEEGNITKIFYETCTESNFTNLGEVISNGEITSTTEETTFELVKNEEIQATSTGAVVYYYIILEYPNKEESQNIDMNGIFIGITTIQTLEKKEILTKDLILANNTIDTSRSSGEFTSTFEEVTAGKIFSAEDDDGTTYFFAGANPNNWVQFGQYQSDIYYGYYSTSSTSNYKEYASLEACQNAENYNVNCTFMKGKDIYWRIIRINGDGSVRLIYNGPKKSKIGPTTRIGVSTFNTNTGDNAYIGYMYGTQKSDNYADTHTNINSSEIKKVLDTWYESNIKENYEKYIDNNAGFCGDRTIDKTVSTFYQGDGFGENATGYAPMGRLYQNDWKLTQIATYKCNQINDLYTSNKSNKGNKALINSIGLITSDEAMYAGGFGESENTSYWLYTKNDYWTISPSFSYNFNQMSVMLVGSSGNVGWDPVNGTARGIRPVINLKSDVLTTGSGTTRDPYRIAE